MLILGHACFTQPQLLCSRFQLILGSHKHAMCQQTCPVECNQLHHCIIMVVSKHRLWHTRLNVLHSTHAGQARQSLLSQDIAAAMLCYLGHAEIIKGDFSAAGPMMTYRDRQRASTAWSSAKELMSPSHGMQGCMPKCGMSAASIAAAQTLRLLESYRYSGRAYSSPRRVLMAM